MDGNQFQTKFHGAYARRQSDSFVHYNEKRNAFFTSLENMESSSKRRRSFGFSNATIAEGGDRADNPQPVELLINNLDSNLSEKVLRNELKAAFRQFHLPILEITMSSQQDHVHVYGEPATSSQDPEKPGRGSLKAIIKVPSPMVARIAVIKLHRTKIGCKRISLTRLRSDKSPPVNVLKAEVLALFDVMTSRELPLVAFQEHYEKRYHRSISMADIHRLKDIIHLKTDDDDVSGGRQVALIENFTLQNWNHSELVEFYPYCRVHYQPRMVSPSTEFTEVFSQPTLPRVKVLLKTLASRVHTLLDTHHGSLPLSSFIHCYMAEFGVDFDYHENPLVPLEHLISCVPGVKIITAHPMGFKQVKWMQNSLVDTPFESQKSRVHLRANESVLDFLDKLLSQFGREVKDLLKNQDQCILPFSKFIPSYHGHFGRQCCVFDYGYTKLIDLLEAVPDIVQILGDGSKRLLTLTHREQTKRFAVEVVKVLRCQPNKRFKLEEYPSLFRDVFAKAFDISNYGVCCVEDILQNVWEGTVEIVDEDGEMVVQLPRKAQSEEEKERTKTLAADVVKLLQSIPSMCLSFSKFIPAYHHYFNRQCKVSDYGFSKLIDLLEELAVSVIDIIKDNSEHEKLISLNQELRQQTVGSRLSKIVKSRGRLPLTELVKVYEVEYGTQLSLHNYDSAELNSLVYSLSSPSVQLPTFDNAQGDGAGVVQLLEQKVLITLMSVSEARLSVDDMLELFKIRYYSDLSADVLIEAAKNIVHLDVVTNEMFLTKPQEFLRDCIACVEHRGNSLTLPQLMDTFIEIFDKEPPDPKDLGFKTISAFFKVYSDYVVLRRQANYYENVYVLGLNEQFLQERRALVGVLAYQSSESSSATPTEEQADNLVERVCLQRQSSSGSTAEVPDPPAEWLSSSRVPVNRRTSLSKPKTRRIAARFDRAAGEKLHKRVENS